MASNPQGPSFLTAWRPYPLVFTTLSFSFTPSKFKKPFFIFVIHLFYCSSKDGCKCAWGRIRNVLRARIETSMSCGPYRMLLYPIRWIGYHTSIHPSPSKAFILSSDDHWSGNDKKKMLNLNSCVLITKEKNQKKKQNLKQWCGEGHPTLDVKHNFFHSSQKICAGFKQIHEAWFGINW